MERFVFDSPAYSLVKSHVYIIWTSRSYSPVVLLQNLEASSSFANEARNGVKQLIDIIPGLIGKAAIGTYFEYQQKPEHHLMLPSSISASDL